MCKSTSSKHNPNDVSFILWFYCTRFIAIEFDADEDECKVRKGGCQQKCLNTEGSFVCWCGRGFRLSTDMKTCIGREGGKRRAREGGREGGEGRKEGMEEGGRGRGEAGGGREGGEGAPPN